MKHKLVYRMLVDAGHTPEKALEIVVDARRGNRHALDWVKMVRVNKFLRGGSNDSIEHRVA